MADIAKSDILSVLQRQHSAIDALMATIIEKDSTLLRHGAIKHDETFRPSESGWIWTAVMDGNEMIKKLEAETFQEAR